MSTSPRIVRRFTVPRVIDRPGDVVAELRAAYRDHRIRVVGRTRIAGREAWRLQVRSPLGRSGNHRPPSSIFLVDAKTFLPRQVIGYGSAVYVRGGPFIPVARAVTRFLTYERLPTTAKNRLLLKMSSHPGAQVLTEDSRRRR
jgi:hypothetical protein